MGLLDKLKAPSDVRNLSVKELELLSEEIRRELITTIDKNGGHLSSNLGIVETTVALYHAFDFSVDKLIFDVGHQCYAHKLLSGRKEKFSTIRTSGGLSGFPDREESNFDAFTVGHAGTSISAGLGYCAARDLKGEDYYVIDVVGDGALSNGLNLEALFTSNVKPNKHIVILNDNGMSINRNDNGLYKLISKGTTKRTYVGGKRVVQRVFRNSFVTRWLMGVRNFLKRLTGGGNYFENHGFKYVGVVDGNNIKELVKILARIKNVSQNKAVLLHIKTTKGKGHRRAEERSDVYHGVGVKLKNECGSFSCALGQAICDLIEKDNKIVAITAGMKDGTGLSKVEERFPKNFFDVGIAEEYAVTYAAGLASGGLKPIVAIYSTFMQRSYDQIVHDVCLQNLPVIFCLDRAGVVGPDGKTHQGVFDLSYLMHIPNVKIFAPNTVEELKDILEYATTLSCPVAIRYPKNAIPEDDLLPIKDGLWKVIKKPSKINILAVGPNMLKLAREVSEIEDGVGVISARSVKPLDEKLLQTISDTDIITIEENSEIGGFGSAICSYFSASGNSNKIINMGIKDKFVEHGSVSDQLKGNQLTKDDLLNAIKSLKRKK